MANRKDNNFGDDENENSLNAGTGNRNFDPYTNKGDRHKNPEEGKDDPTGTRNSGSSSVDRDENNPGKKPGQKRKRSISEDDLKMPSESQELQGNLGEGKKKSQAQVDDELSDKMHKAEDGMSENKNDGNPRFEEYNPGKTTKDENSGKNSGDQKEVIPAKGSKPSIGKQQQPGANLNANKQEEISQPQESLEAKSSAPSFGKQKPETTAKAKEPSKITQSPKGRFEDKSSDPAIEKLERQTTALVKSPAKNTPSGKGRFEDKSFEAGGGNRSRGNDAQNSSESSNEKINLPEHTSTSESAAHESNLREGSPGGTTGNFQKDTNQAGSSKGEEKTTASGTRDKENISPGPEVKGSGKKAKEKKTESKDSSIADDLKNMAMATAAKFAEKYLPDEETRDEITRTAMEFLPDQEDIKKSIKNAKNKFSPEIEQVNKLFDQFISPEEIREKTEKVQKAAKRIKNKFQEGSAEKSFKDMSLISDYDVFLFKEGRHFHLYNKFGSHLMEYNGTSGVYFAVWAPNAKQVSVIGDFNNWVKMANPMKSRPDESGIWEIFIPEAKQGSLYKYFVQSTSGYEAEKGDPFAFMWEVPPNTASVVWDLKSEWGDEEWLSQRKIKAGKAKPVSVYELHVGSWKRVPEDGNRSLSYKELAIELPVYLNEMGFTHVEFMPVMEHPFFGSWGYQVTGYFAPSSRFGNPQEFMLLIDALHKAGIGVILDWVPSHFPSDLHGLHYFDGTYLYEHQDPQKGFHPDWQSYIFNYGRNEVRSFLISNALFWLDKFHADGLRVDAVASMLYLDYSRKHGEWEPNEHGGNENLEAISFLKQFNEVVYSEFPDTMTIAEESTAWPMVSRPTFMGGLGFGMKWMMGWMHDTLEYYKKDPIHRKHHQDTITFSTNYAFTENFMLPLSHDEVVYGKKSLFNKMPGDQWNKFSNLRALYSYMFAHPGTKLLFMGGEFAQVEEWGHDTSLDWHLTKDGPHKEMQETIKALNRMYRQEPALYEKAFSPDGFEWVDFNDRENSIISFLRKGNDPEDTIVVVCNLTPVPRENYRIGVPAGGTWKEIYNSDDRNFGGSNVKNSEIIKSSALSMHRMDHSIALTLPPMGVIYLKRT